TRFTADGQVDFQTYGDGGYDFSYYGTSTDVSDRAGNDKRFEFTAGSTLPDRWVEIDGGVEYATVYEHNGQGELTRTESPLGTVLERTFDDAAGDPRDRGNLLELKRLPTPGRATEVINTVGLADFATDPVEDDPTELIWSYTYDSRF